MADGGNQYHRTAPGDVVALHSFKALARTLTSKNRGCGGSVNSPLGAPLGFAGTTLLPHGPLDTPLEPILDRHVR